ncbi:helix-turn-helix transcriptional regulator [Roseomonas marmotae]|uniref:Helix-turn-helix domain-containing protein n=1 Tax=Roseomonas marmotae TaxID=2768161 RepID=A0ABS3K8L9_9PROT|nr:helix-turn-helix transcriptional regulator [Roseomonas marmotae]MBO1073808.1 helix-turn-helix domain-containing protein [Roseomonas marmotae]QTI78562.1 helix-turn-helix domain-containing protein [Roseomonas marmotae]
MNKLARIEARRAVADFIRDRRACLAPEDVGLQRGARRRTPGLRRDEVAQLAGVGITWYTWFEQGRDIQVSADFLERLSRAFRLNATERSHLFTLAQQRPPPHRPPQETRLPDAVRRILASLHMPACVMTRRWDVVAWNAPAIEILGDFAALPEDERNILHLIFTSSGFQQRMASWEEDARGTLEKFRLDFARADGDPGFAALVAELAARSADFAKWWPRQEVRPVGDGMKRLRHPRHGVLEFQHATFSVEGGSELRMVVYTAAGDA